MRHAGTWVRGTAAAAALALCGCSLLGGTADAGNGVRTDPEPEAPLRSADTAFTSVDPTPTRGIAPAAPSSTVVAVLHVQIPAHDAASASNVWTHFNESRIDEEHARRLRANGIRVGVAHVSAFEPVRELLNTFARQRVSQTAPVNVPAGYPMLLEMDTEPRDQTIFCVAGDGLLSGGTWAASRSVIRLSYVPQSRESRRVRFVATPEIHQRAEGYRWVRTEAGEMQTANERCTVFTAATIELLLSADEFVLIAPSETIGVSGLIGGAVLTQQVEGETYHSYLFLRPEVANVAQRN